MKLAVVGVTGMVGRKMLEVLDERDFPVSELIPVASSRSLGKIISFRGRDYRVTGIEEAVEKTPDIALFSAGGSTSREWAPAFASSGCTVIDNSSAWRMDKDIPLVVPEINMKKVSSTNRIIANPNCSTIQLVMALAPLHYEYGIKRLVISTYQSVTGSGMKGVQQLEDEKAGLEAEKIYLHPINNNCLPHCADFDQTGYSTEEIKLVNETRKILDDSSIMLTATAVRVPVTGGHSESVNIEFKRDFELDDIRRRLSEFPGVIVQDNPHEGIYPMPLTAQGSDKVYVGRVRRDYSTPNALNMWIVSDNIRKGAATNAIQIAEGLIS